MYLVILGVTARVGLFVTIFFEAKELQKRIYTAIPNAIAAVAIEFGRFFIPYYMDSLTWFFQEVKGIGLFQILQDILKCNSHNFSRVKIKLIFLKKKAIKSCLRLIKGITFAASNKGSYW